jgi:hypothetical protein
MFGKSVWLSEPAKTCVIADERWETEVIGRKAVMKVAAEETAGDPSVYRIYWPLCLYAGRAPAGIVGVITIMKPVTAQEHQLIPLVMPAFPYGNNKLLKWILLGACSTVFRLQDEEFLLSAD